MKEHKSNIIYFAVWLQKLIEKHKMLKFTSYSYRDQISDINIIVVSDEAKKKQQYTFTELFTSSTTLKFANTILKLP